jgi:hypothetical protein
VYFDLDTVITGNIDHILSLPDKFATLRDFYRPKGLQTAYIMWEPDYASFIWKKLETNHKDYNKLLKYAGGTNKFLEDSVGVGKDVVRIQDKFPGECVSYKVHIRDRKDTFNLTNEKIIFFHGMPRPHEVSYLSFMKEHWK